MRRILDSIRESALMLTFPLLSKDSLEVEMSSISLTILNKEHLKLNHDEWLLLRNSFQRMTSWLDLPTIWKESLQSSQFRMSSDLTQGESKECLRSITNRVHSSQGTINTTLITLILKLRLLTSKSDCNPFKPLQIRKRVL
jgi:hypothetical protein